jgi:hypothetical protein
MADARHDTDNAQSETPAESGTKKVYRPPVLIKLGSLRAMTMSLFGGGASDGRPSRGTKRGGNFDRTD